MKNMFIVISVFLFFGFNSCTDSEINSPKYQNIYQLIERILPGKSSQFIIENLIVKDGKETFELSSKDSKIILKGTSELALAKAFNLYLNNYCHIRVSWYKEDPVLTPEILPTVETPVTRECRFEKRFFLNYCTFGYTMLWWQWG